MRRTLTLCLFLMFSLSVTAQNATYDLRFANPIINYTNNAFFFDVEIKSNSNDGEFFMADQSICFEYDDVAFINGFADLAESYIDGLVLQDPYQTISLFSTAAITVNANTVCYSVTLVDGDGFFLPSSHWSRVATFALAIADLSQLANVTFNSPTDQPPTIVNEKSNGIVFQAEIGFSTNITNLSFSNLPIELSFFEADVNRSNDVELTWQTLSESGNASFTIERSQDGEEFKTIGQVAGAGTSSEIIDYSFIDDDPLLGKSYYRLKQNDFDGSFDYSEVVTVFIGHQFGETISIYPNPVKSQLNLNFQEFPGEDMQLQIFNMDGRLVYSKEVEVNDGTILEISVIVEGLPSGNYQVRVSGSEENGYVAFGRFMKL